MLIEALQGVVNIFTDEETVLWTNPNPSSVFAAQTITLSDSLNNYDEIKVVYKEVYSAVKTKEFTIKISDWLRSDYGNTSFIFGIYSYTNYAWCRQFTYSTTTSISVSTCYRLNNQSNNGNCSVPIKVIGIKKIAAKYGVLPDFGNEPDVEYNNPSAGTSGTAEITVTRKPRYILCAMWTTTGTGYAGQLGIIDVDNEKAIRAGYIGSTLASHNFEDWTNVSSYFPTISDTQVIYDISAWTADHRVYIGIYY